MSKRIGSLETASSLRFFNDLNENPMIGDKRSRSYYINLKNHKFPINKIQIDNLPVYYLYGQENKVLELLQNKFSRTFGAYKKKYLRTLGFKECKKCKEQRHSREFLKKNVRICALCVIDEMGDSA